MYDDDQPPLGLVLLADPLSFALLHGDSLVAVASFALSEAGVDLFDSTLDFDWVRGTGRALVLHDVCCPATPPAFIAECVTRSLAAKPGGSERVVVGFRPVTDTIKRIDAERIGASVDRAALRQLASPVVLPAAVVAEMDWSTVVAAPSGTPTLSEVVRAVEDAGGAEIEWVTAPAVARRIADVDDLKVLEAMS